LKQKNLANIAKVFTLQTDKYLGGYAMKFIILCSILISSYAMAEEREVIGGDILYTASTVLNDEQVATFMAQQAAIRLLITECQYPHKDIKIFKNTMKQVDGYYTATAQAGLSFESCNEIKRAPISKRNGLISEEIVKNQLMYDAHLKKMLGIKDPPSAKVVQAEKDLEKAAEAQRRAEADEKDELIEKQTLHIFNLKREIYRLTKRPTSLTLTNIYAGQIGPKDAEQMSPKKKACLAKASALTAKAQALAVNNTPSGNMSQGEASVYWNQAEDMRRGCK
jgi:hypothetical protein